MMMKLALISYLNMRPFAIVPPPAGWEVLSLPPRQALDGLLQGKVAAAVVPVGGIPPLKGVYPSLGSYGIAACGAVKSVLFFSQIPWDAFTSEHCVFLTGESVTSIRLLYLLLGHRMGFDNLPRLASPGETPDGELLIGDAALRHNPAPFVMDLAQEWLVRYGLPCVFARWLLRPDVPLAEQHTLIHWIESVIAQKKQLIQSIEAQEIGFLQPMIRSYLTPIRYRLQEKETQSEAIFHAEMIRLGRSPLFAQAPS